MNIQNVITWMREDDVGFWCVLDEYINGAHRGEREKFGRNQLKKSEHWVV